MSKVNELVQQLAEINSSISGDDLLSDVTQKLEAMRVIQDEINKAVGNVINKQLRQTFCNEVKSRKPELREFELSDKYMRATSYPYELYHKSTVNTTGKYLKPTYSKEYPTVMYLSNNGDMIKTQYHRMVATCVLNDGVTLGDSVNVDHIHQDRFNWNADDLAIVDSKTNQRNRGSAQWIDEELIGDDVVHMDIYRNKQGKIVDISAECIYKAVIQGESILFTWEPNGKYRRCPITNVKGSYHTRGVIGKKHYVIDKLYSTEEETDDEEMFSQ